MNVPDSIQRYSDWRAALRHLARASIHAGISSVLAVVGTNGAEKLAPDVLHGIGLDWRQMGAVFLTAAILEALRRIQQATADTSAPFSSQPQL